MIDKNPFDQNRIIYLSGEFNQTQARGVILRLLHLEMLDPTKDIILFIDSYGGYVDSLIAIHDAIKLLRCDVVTCCLGTAMSCGQLLLISGTKGKRFITENSRVMIHELSSGSYGKLSDLEITISETKRLNKEIFEKFNVNYTKLSKKDLTDMKGRDTYLTAKEALKYGMVDHIITNPSVLYKNINI